MKSRKLSISLIMLIMVSHPILLEAQASGQEAGLTPRNIRARKLAQNWQGETVQLTLTDGRLVVGRFVGADFFSFTLETENKQVVLPIDKVRAVALKPGLMEAGLTLVSGILGGGLGAGIVTLTAPGTSATVTTTVAVGGAGIGLWWGYRTFFQEVVIELGD